MMSTIVQLCFTRNTIQVRHCRYNRNTITNESFNHSRCYHYFFETMYKQSSHTRCVYCENARRIYFFLFSKFPTSFERGGVTSQLYPYKNKKIFHPTTPSKSGIIPIIVLVILQSDCITLQNYP